MGFSDLNPWSDDFDSGRFAAAVATMGMTEVGGARPLIEEGLEEADVDLSGLGGSLGESLGWLQNQGAAAFPGTVDAVDQSVYMSPYESDLVSQGLTQTNNQAGLSLEAANEAYDLAGDAVDIGAQSGQTAQDLALNVGQDAHNTSQQGGQALQVLGGNTYGQATEDQAQLEALGQYLGLSGEQLGTYINNQGQALGEEQAGVGGLYGSILTQMGGQALGVDNTYNPTLQGLAFQAGSTGSRYASQLGGLGTQLQGVGQELYNRGAPVYDPNQQTGLLQQTNQYAQDLANLEAVQGPSAAQAQLAMATNQNMQNNLALARSGSGFGESAQAMSQAIAANALAGQDAANQSAILRAQEDQAWRQRQASNLQGAGGLGLGAGQQFGEQTQFGATLEQTQAEQNANAYLSALAQSGQLTESAAQTALQGLVQSGQLTQQQADNMFQGIGLSGQLVGQGAATHQAGLDAGAATQLQGMGLALDATQQGQQMGLDAIQSGIQAGQAGTQLAGDLVAQGTGLQLQGNELGLAAIDSFLAGGEQQLAGIQTADQLINTALGGVGQASDIYQGGIQQALDAYNQAVTNEQNWEQLGISQEQAETDRQRNYMELIGALAQAVGEAIPG